MFPVVYALVVLIISLRPEIKRRTFHELKLIAVWVDPNELISPVESNVELNSAEPNSVEPNKSKKQFIRYHNLCI